MSRSVTSVMLSHWRQKEQAGCNLLLVRWGGDNVYTAGQPRPGKCEISASATAGHSDFEDMHVREEEKNVFIGMECK